MSQEDLNVLRNNVCRLSRRGRDAVILEYHPDSAVEAVKSIKEWLAADLAKDREKAKVAAKKKAEAERNRANKKAEQERKLFEAMKAKFEGGKT